jgi:hypothetical protein
MSQENTHAKPWLGNLMMVFSILVVFVGVPMAFVLAGSFSEWLSTTGVHANPNFAGGYPIAEFSVFERHLRGQASSADISEVAKALAVSKFSVKKVAFRPMSGMGIEPRLNLIFEFDGELPDPHNSSQKFSATVMHVYIKVPGKKAGTVTSDKAAAVDFGDEGWNYQVIIDGLHEQARVFDLSGSLVARGLGLFVNYEYASKSGNNQQAKRQAAKTILTAALPLESIGDPAVGTWQYYVLVGMADSRHPSMMMHSAPDGGLAVYSAAAPGEPGQVSAAGARPRLLPLVVSNRN